MTGDADEPGPGVDQPRTHLAWQLRQQARACAALGSPLYARLLEAAAGDVEAGGPTLTVLHPQLAPGRGAAIALRLMAAVHRLVLDGEAPRLAVHYPSAGGDAGDPDAAAAVFLAVVAERATQLTQHVAAPCQTNEVGRAAPLAGELLRLAGEWGGPPLRLLEIGCAAGLLLRWDQFTYGDHVRRWGPADSPVDLVGLWSEPPPWPLPPRVEIAERRGADRAPIDPTSEAGRLALAASLWADQPERHRRLRGACAVAAATPARIDAASAAEWVAEVLAEPAAGLGTVLWHTVLWEYLSERERGELARAVGATGDRATARAPLAWVRLEPATSLRTHALTVTAWPGGHERRVAVSGAHGQQVRWRARGRRHRGKLPR